ncbi:MAG: HD-GYP domain-containing protein [Candidatus Omnitrophica bacterium]|nr:HD-GYP domain-containing protein [Candidatus Omnitrophota bacterium]
MTDQKTFKNSVKELSKQFALLLSELALYPSNHPHIAAQLQQVIDRLTAVHEIVEEVTIEISEGFFTFDGIPLYDIKLQTDKAVQLCASKGISRITLCRGLAPQQVSEFAQLLHDKTQAPTAEQVGLTLRTMGITALRVDSAVSRETDEQVPAGLAGKKTYGASVEANKLIYGALQSGQPLPLEVVDTVAKDITAMINRDPGTGLTLASLRNYDEYTFTHSANVAILAVTVAAAIFDDAALLQQLARAAILHDVGKTRIPVEILNKPEKLNDEEWQIMQQHPMLGAVILEEQKNIDRLSILIALQHHMRFNMTGYPKIPGHNTLHPFSLIVNICDIYDAITSRRVYKTPLPADKALAIMVRLIGNDFDPQFFKIFIQMMGIYPPGSFVRLNTGELAITVRARPQSLLQPDIKIISDPQGNLLAAPASVHLSAAAQERTIAEMVDPVSLGLNALDFL